MKIGEKIYREVMKEKMYLLRFNLNKYLCLVNIKQVNSIIYTYCNINIMLDVFFVQSCNFFLLIIYSKLIIIKNVIVNKSVQSLLYKAFGLC